MKFRVMRDGDTSQDGIVENVVIASPEVAEANGWFPCADECAPGREFRGGVMLPISPPPLDMDALRAERNARLRASDWTQLPDVELSAEQKASWASYRRALRSLPDSIEEGATSVEWPDMPERKT